MGDQSIEIKVEALQVKGLKVAVLKFEVEEVKILTVEINGQVLENKHFLQLKAKNPFFLKCPLFVIE